MQKKKKKIPGSNGPSWPRPSLGLPSPSMLFAQLRFMPIRRTEWVWRMLCSSLFRALAPPFLSCYLTSWLSVLTAFVTQCLWSGFVCGSSVGSCAFLGYSIETLVPSSILVGNCSQYPRVDRAYTVQGSCTGSVLCPAFFCCFV